MQNTNALFDELLEAYRTSDDPDRFLREFLLRLEDVTSNAVVATERKLERLDAAKARLDAAREIPRADTSEEPQDRSREDDDEQPPDVRDEQQPDVDDEQEAHQDQEQVDEPPRKRKAKRAVAGSKAPKRTRTRVH